MYTGDNGTLLDLHYHLGSQISLLCEVARGPMQESSVQWVFQRTTGEEELVLNEDTGRGGIMINTWHQDPDTMVSNLTLYKAGHSDKGHYTCRLPHSLAELGNATILVHILNKTLTEPVQGGATLYFLSPLLLSSISLITSIEL